MAAPPGTLLGRHGQPAPARALSSSCNGSSSNPLYCGRHCNRQMGLLRRCLPAASASPAAAVLLGCAARSRRCVAAAAAKRRKLFGVSSAVRLALLPAVSTFCATYHRYLTVAAFCFVLMQSLLLATCIVRHLLCWLIMHCYALAALCLRLVCAGGPSKQQR
jgi:hypothetical protein